MQRIATFAVFALFTMSCAAKSTQPTAVTPSTTSIKVKEMTFKASKPAKTLKRYNAYSRYATMTFYLRDLRNDGKGPYVKFYDSTRNYKWSWGRYFLQYYNKWLRIRIRCRRGHKICLGAWQGKRYWGCGRGCHKYCSGCCYYCSYQTRRINLW